jgi:hypothetical protein
MAKHYENITDPKVRSYCRAMEANADGWRKFTARVNALPQELTDLFQKYPLPTPLLSLKTGEATGLLLAVKHESERISYEDSQIRVAGFDARRAGKPITDNPYAKTVADLDSEDGYTTLLNSHAAVPWYIGWKQAARAGEDHYPD